MTELKKGELFNETVIFKETPHNVSVVATTEADLMVLDKEKFLELIHEYSQLSSKIMWKIGEKLRKRLAETTTLFSDTKQEDTDISDLL